MSQNNILFMLLGKIRNQGWIDFLWWKWQSKVILFSQCLDRLTRDLTLGVRDAEMEGQMHYLTSWFNHAILLLSLFYELLCMHTSCVVSRTSFATFIIPLFMVRGKRTEVRNWSFKRSIGNQGFALWAAIHNSWSKAGHVFRTINGSVIGTHIWIFSLR